MKARVSVMIQVPATSESNVRTEPAAAAANSRVPEPIRSTEVALERPSTSSPWTEAEG